METARERFNRQEQERASKAEPRRDTAVIASKQVGEGPLSQGLRRKAELRKRLAQLGVADRLAELPDAEEDLAGIERLCAEQEQVNK